MEIRARYERTRMKQRELAKEYGVSQKLIFNIIHRKAWTHI